MALFPSMMMSSKSQTNVTLNELDLAGDNMVGPEGAQYLAEMLKVTHSVSSRRESFTGESQAAVAVLAFC